MRIGQNPAKVKGSPAYAPKKVGLASLTYVPALEGYHREALEVIDVHLASLRQSLPEECDLCVFDNGSCPEVLAYLNERWRSGVIDWLFLSNHNLGKNGILNWVFSAMPNEYIGYSDSDVFFRKGWLEASLKIFEAFPKAGMVSAQPVFFDFLKGQGRTAAAIAATPGLRVSEVTPRPEIVEEYCDGINASEELRRQFRQQRLQVAVSEASGIQAVTSATDMQFMLRREVARKLAPVPIAGALTGKDAIEIPLGIENLGYWILSTAEPLVWHMGNSLEARPTAEVEAIQKLQRIAATATGQSAARGKGAKGKLKTTLGKWVRRSPGFKRVMERVYTALFGILYEE